MGQSLSHLLIHLRALHPSVQSSIGVSPVSSSSEELRDGEPVSSPVNRYPWCPTQARRLCYFGHRRDAYATLDAGSEPQRVHIKLARHTETGNICSSQTTRNSEPRTRNRAARSVLTQRLNFRALRGWSSQPSLHVSATAAQLALQLPIVGKIRLDQLPIST